MTSHEPSKSSEVRIATEAEVATALEAHNWYEHDGQRIVSSAGGPAYLVMNAVLRHIPNPATFRNLFADDKSIKVNDYLVENIPVGPALSDGAILAIGSNPTHVYLISNHKKHAIPSNEIFDRFGFNRARIQTYADVAIDAIPFGPNVG